MSSLITSVASPEASGEPGPGIVQNYRERLQALGYSPGLMGKCLRTILNLISWLSANGTGIETLDVRVLHRFLNHDCACPRPRGYRKNPERARWHLHRFLGGDSGFCREELFGPSRRLWPFGRYDCVAIGSFRGAHDASGFAGRPGVEEPAVVPLADESDRAGSTIGV